MAVTAKFLADFTSFTDAVAKAEVSLKSFETSAGKVTVSLNKMADSFSGRKVVQDAELATKAVMEIGGASKLTTAEQTRLNAILTEAIEKYKALGKSAPADMVALAKATAQTKDATSTLSTAVVALGSFFGTMAANAASALGRQAVQGAKDLASSLADLALKGAAVADVEENFKRLTAQVGMLGSSLLGTLRAGTHSTINDFELMQRVNQNLAAGLVLTESQFGTLTKGAFALAQATGTDVKTALDAMNDAMLTGRTRAIALLTGKIDLEAAENKYANTLGVLRKELTDEQKLEAARQAILESVGAATARLGDQMDGLDEKVQQARTAWDNFTLALGKSLAQSAVLGAAIDALGTSLKTAFGPDQQTKVQSVTRLIEQGSIALVGFAQAGVSTAEFIGKSFYQLRESIFGVLQGIAEGIAFMTRQLASLEETKAAIPGLGLLWRDTAKDTRAAADALGAVADSFKRTSIDANTAQVKIGQGADIARTALDNMYNAMTKAANQPVVSPTAAKDVLAVGAALQHTGTAAAQLAKTDFLAPTFGPTMAAAAAQTAALATATDQSTGAAERSAAAAAKQQAAIAERLRLQKEAAAAEQAHAAAVKNLADTFSGATSIREANLAIEALNLNLKLGVAWWEMDAAQVTALNKTLGDAITAYERFGKVAPEAMRDLFIQTTRMPAVLSGIAEGVGKIGAQFDVVIPKMVDASTLLTYIGGIPFGAKIGQQLEIPKSPLKEFKLNLDALSRALSDLATTAGGAFGEVARGLATIVSAARTAQESIKMLRDASAAKFDISSILGMTSGVLGLVSAALAAGKAIAGIFDRDKGRELVVAFAEAQGGFDALHVRLLELGDEGERLWIALTQGVGRNNPEQAKAAIAAIEAALGKQAAAQDDVTAATEEQAQATIETASQAAKALDELGPKLKDNAAAWGDWGDTVTGILQGIASSVRSLPMPSVPGVSAAAPSAWPSYASGTNGYINFGSGTPVVLHGWERVTPRNAEQAGATTTIVVPVYLDGRQVAEVTVPHMAAVLARHGVGQ